MASALCIRVTDSRSRRSGDGAPVARDAATGRRPAVMRTPACTCPSPSRGTRRPAGDPACRARSSACRARPGEPGATDVSLPIRTEYRRGRARHGAERPPGCARRLAVGGAASRQSRARRTRTHCGVPRHKGIIAAVRGIEDAPLPRRRKLWWTIRRGLGLYDPEVLRSEAIKVGLLATVRDQPPLEQPELEDAVQLALFAPVRDERCGGAWPPARRVRDSLFAPVRDERSSPD